MNRSYIIARLVSGMKSAQAYARARSDENALQLLNTGFVFGIILGKD